VNIRDSTFDVMRRLGMTRIFGNPGSTEVAFLTDLPSDLEFVLGLHEGTVVGMATGYAIGQGSPAFVNLHTAPGLGNALNAIANARDCRAPLVIVVGQQDRRQLASSPFLAGRALERLAGEYPVWTSLPVRAQDVPGAIARAYHEAVTRRGPALVVVPMGDWEQSSDPLAIGAPANVLRPRAVDPEELEELAMLVGGARSPVLVVGAGAASDAGWESVTALAEALGSPVWQEAFGSRPGFPQNHPLFAGHLPWMRARMHERLAPHDLVIAVGTHALRTYVFDDDVALLGPHTRVAVISEDPEEVHRSGCDIGVLAPVAETAAALVAQIPARGGARERPLHSPPPAPAPPGPGEKLRPGHVFTALAERLPEDVVLVEETPSSRPELLERIPSRTPLGFIANANGALGFGLTGAIGLRMALPDRPVVAVVGDGSAMYAIQSLWSAAHYRVGVLLIVMNNGGYAIMDAQAQERGGAPAWPGFPGIDFSGIARALGCPAVRVTDLETLLATLDDVLPALAARQDPILVEVELQP
jgi:benzoylformate decarboxylase